MYIIHNQINQGSQDKEDKVCPANEKKASDCVPDGIKIPFQLYVCPSREMITSDLMPVLW